MGCSLPADTENTACVIDSIPDPYSDVPASVRGSGMVISGAESPQQEKSGKARFTRCSRTFC